MFAHLIEAILTKLFIIVKKHYSFSKSTKDKRNISLNTQNYSFSRQSKFLPNNNN